MLSRENIENLVSQYRLLNNLAENRPIILPGEHRENEEYIHETMY